MKTTWASPWTWLSGATNDDRALDKVVREAQDRFSRLAQESSARRRRLAEGVKLDAAAQSQLAMALALFAVAARDRLGLTPYDVQFRAAAAMALGFAVEMQTGEGKSLAVAAAAAALGLQGRTVHIATVNQYLADRDHGLFAPVMEALGLEARRLHDAMSPDEKRRAYSCPLVYGTGYAFGFDYLREQLAAIRGRSDELGDRVRRRLANSPAAPPPLRFDCTLVDELDGVLLDEAGVPLILSEPAPQVAVNYDILARAQETALALKPDVHYLVDRIRNSLGIHENGRQCILGAFPRKVGAELRRPWLQYVSDALTAKRLLRRDVDYVVQQGRIWIVDASTGRIFDDRRWPEGLQQAVEFAEGLTISAPTRSAARITRQRFFRHYRTLAGTSGTLREAGKELAATYRLKLCVIPPRLPSRLAILPPRIFGSASSRNRAVAAEVAAHRSQRRPVLVGCRTIAVSCELSKLFHRAAIEHQVLNGVQSADEADIVARAGRSGSVVVATNLAGRGTDIKLDCNALDAGGLHVVGVEYHDSVRIDRQLIGRAGRQGDPGSGRFFISADDTLWHAAPQLRERMLRAADDDGEIREDLSAEIRQVRDAIEAEAVVRRGEVAAADARLDQILDVLAQSE